MGAKIFVGNLPVIVSESQLHKIFSRCGQVQSVKVVTDFRTGCSKGFAFVTMGNSQEAQKVISCFDKVMLDGKPIIVTEAKTIGNSVNSSSDRSGGIRTYRRSKPEDQIFRMAL